MEALRKRQAPTGRRSRSGTATRKGRFCRRFGARGRSGEAAARLLRGKGDFAGGSAHAAVAGSTPRVDGKKGSPVRVRKRALRKAWIRHLSCARWVSGCVRVCLVGRIWAAYAK